MLKPSTNITAQRLLRHCALASAVLVQGFNYAEADNLLPSPTSETPWAWSRLDWHTLDQLSPTQKASIPIGCCGAFIQPDDMVTKHNNAGAAQPAAQSDISISGASSQITKQSTIMTGDVVLTQGERKISGDYAELFNEPQGVQLKGNVLFREPGFLLQGSAATINLEQNTLIIDHARYVLHEQRVHGEAEQIQRDDKGVITLTNSTYSSCTPGDEVWYLKSNSMTLDAANGQGSARNVRIEVLDVPVFYFPYLRFPVGGQRQSGFLAPSFSRDESGINISMPYYLNLAENYDATIIPRHISERGNQLGGEFRHLSPSFESAVAATWLADNKLGEDRWLLGVKQEGGKFKPWSTLIDTTRVSDNNYFDDLDNSGLSISRNTHLQQHAAAGYMTDHWDNSIEVLEYQTLRTSELSDPYQKLPDIGAVGNYYLGSGFSTRLSQHFTRFDHRDQSQVTGERLTGDYRLAWRSDWQAGFIEPAVEMHHLEQALNNAATEDNPHVSIPAANIDMGLTFVHDDANYRQTLEPRLYYNYTPYKNQSDFQLFDTDEMNISYSQLFTSSRFSGSDRIGDANQTSLGVISRWLDNQSGHEWLQLGVGQTFYNEDRKVTAFDPASFALLPKTVQGQYRNSQSPLIGIAQWEFLPQWRLNSELAWNEESHQTHNGSVFIHYQGQAEELFSVGYRYVQLLHWTGVSYLQETVEQGDISAYWPITAQWAVVGRSLYDITNQRNLETLLGFQYEDCCWRLRTVYRNWATNPNEVFDVKQHQEDQGIYLEIQFKNLAGIGTKTTNMLKDSIYGYNKND